MADAEDLKSSGPQGRAGSSPALGIQNRQVARGLASHLRAFQPRSEQSMPKARPMLAIGLTVLIVLAGFAFTRNLIDFPVYYAAGQSLRGGRADLYAADFALGRVMDYRYPPFFLLAFWPLWLLPYKVAAYLWYLFGVAEIALCVLFIRRVAAIPSQKKWLWLVVFFAVAPYFVIV